MTETPITLQTLAELTALANGVIPADERDAGAASVHAGPALAARLRFNPRAEVYLGGLKTARDLARTTFGAAVESLSAGQMQELLGTLCTESPQFFRQLRADVCALYLSDPGVWHRIGFPGESTGLGGYPDFDQPQTNTLE